MAKALAPSAPISIPANVQASSRESAQFQALKRSLSNITSWELTDNSFNTGLVMKFTESANEQQARVLLELLKSA